MHCPNCGADRPKVPETRRLNRAVRRLRHCRACGHSWETIEVILTEQVKAQLNRGEQLDMLDLLADQPEPMRLRGAP